MTTVVAQALHTAATVLREEAPQDGMVSRRRRGPAPAHRGQARAAGPQLLPGIWRHIVDLSRPWRNLAADIEALAESVDTARGGGTP
ncbi:hypothetical protein AB0L56_26105 [Streptomyces sp. NPDC052079]|uniref:hypothetical protein n=1 Tax=Streptomyces sp. NPDC052079 TaxID=3155526 RepID=UPI0034222FE3